MKNKIKEMLNKPFAGANSSYTTFTVLGASRDDVEPVIVKAAEDGKLGKVFRICTTSEVDGNYSFAIWDEFPYFAEYFSRHLPEHIVIGDLGWTYCAVQIYINGKEAVAGQDYFMELSYEESDDDGDCYDAEWSIMDRKGFATKGGCGMITNNELLSLISIRGRNTTWQ